MTKRSDGVSAALTALHLLFVLAPVYLSAWLGLGWHLLPLWLWFGIAMNGLLNLMHEAAHLHVFSGRTPNEVLGRWILGPLALADFDAYRDRHWEHHRRLGEADDPKEAYRIAIGGRKLAVLVARCLLGIEALSKLRGQSGGGPARSKRWLLRTAVVHAVIGLSLLAAARGSILAAGAAYALYLHSLAALTVLMADLRAIAEHHAQGNGARVGGAALRNFTSNPISWLAFGAYGFTDHATHHLKPGIPYYLLPAATADLAATRPELKPAKGYVPMLWDLWRLGARSHDPT